MIAVVSALAGAAIASVAFVVLSSSDAAPPSGRDAVSLVHQVDDAGPTPLVAPSVARMKATPPTTEPPAEPPLTKDDLF